MSYDSAAGPVSSGSGWRMKREERAVLIYFFIFIYLTYMLFYLLN